VDINVKIKKMKKIIKLTEDDLTRIIKRVIRETDETLHHYQVKPKMMKKKMMT